MINSEEMEKLRIRQKLSARLPTPTRPNRHKGERGESGLTGESGPLVDLESSEKVHGMYVEDENGELTWVEGYDLVWDNNSSTQEVTVDYRDLTQNQESIAAFKKISSDISRFLSLNQSRLFTYRSTYPPMGSESQQTLDIIARLGTLERMYERALAERQNDGRKYGSNY
jgi:hypothetical protein